VGVLLAELGAKPPYVDVDRPGAPVVLVAPYPVEQGLAGEDLARVLAQEPQQLVLHVGQVEHAAGHRRLVGLEVEDQGTVLDQVRSQAPTGPPQQVAQADEDLPFAERSDAEVVEEVVAQRQVTQLVGADHQEERVERDLSPSDLPAQRHGARQVVESTHHRAAPVVAARAALGRLELAGRPHAPEVVASLAERSLHHRRQRIGVAEQRFHGGQPVPGAMATA
jgi:hypothetical protein